MARTWTAPPQVRRRTSPWDDPDVIRAELFSRERFVEHAVSLADSHVVVRRAPRVLGLLDRLEANSRALVRAQRSIARSLELGHHVTPAGEWLIDNFHVVEKHLGQIRLDLPPSYFKELPLLGPGFLEGHPRVFGVVWAYVAHTDSLVDPELLADYVNAYEDRKSLSLGELWAAPIALRFLLIENLRRIADRVVAGGEDRERANAVADRLLGIEGHDPVPVARAVPKGAELPSSSFAVQLLRRLSGTSLAEPRAWLDERLESVSLVESALRADESYVALDFATRNLYRSNVEDLAHGSDQPEVDIARAVLQRASTHEDEVLRDPGRGDGAVPGRSVDVRRRRPRRAEGGGRSPGRREHHPRRATARVRRPAADHRRR